MADRKRLLRIFTGQLLQLVLSESRRTRFGGAPVMNLEVAKFVAIALKRYLAGKHKSIEGALGLKQEKRGRRKGSGLSNLDVALQIAKMKHDGKTDDEIGEELDKDPREVRRIAKTYREDIIEHALKILPSPKEHDDRRREREVLLQTLRCELEDANKSKKFHRVRSGVIKSPT